MPITIKTGNVKYKSNVTGNYVGINAVSDNATADQIEDIEDAGTAQVAAVEAKGVEVRESIPEEYTELTNDVTNLKSADEESESWLKVGDSDA